MICMGSAIWGLMWIAPGVWCRPVETGLLTAYKTAGGPCPHDDLPFLGRGKVVVRTGRPQVGSKGLRGPMLTIFAVILSLTPPLPLLFSFVEGSIL